MFRNKKIPRQKKSVLVITTKAKAKELIHLTYNLYVSFDIKHMCHVTYNTCDILK